jgi:hypothetical protein
MQRVHIDLERMSEPDKQKLCQILDREESWEQLGKLMQFSDFDIAVRCLLNRLVSLQSPLIGFF